MAFLNAMLELLQSLWDHTGNDGGETERERSIRLAREYFSIQVEREKEKLRFKIQKAKFALLEKTPGMDAQALETIKAELTLKERLLNTEFLEIERDYFNGEILDALQAERLRWARYSEAQDRIAWLETQGEAGRDEIAALKREFAEMDEWVKRRVLDSDGPA
ncbi:MAG: hypothetical protein JWO30_1326 [Fibrobacteres bacterium]|nr:hypothetical protein [Fibrobacterota bacterium]